MAFSVDPNSFSNQPVNCQFLTNETVFASSQSELPNHFRANYTGFHRTKHFIPQIINGGNTTTASRIPKTFSSQRVANEVRNTTCLVPQRIQVVQTAVNIDYFPLQNQSISSNIYGPVGDGQFCVTEVVRTQNVVRTQLLNSVSTRDRFLSPNHGSSVWINNNQLGQTQYVQNQSNHPTFTKTQPFNNHVSHFHNPSTHNFGPSCYLSNNNCPNVTQSSSHNSQNPRYEPYIATHHVPQPNSLIRDSTISDPQPLGAYFPPETKNPIPSQNDESQDSPTDTSEEEHDESEIEYDGQTHSLPHEKYGPYTCPRCKGVFTTSQLFAAHMGSHYKHETVEQRRKRHLAKYGKKHIRLVQSRDELTLVPYEPSKEPITTVAAVEHKIRNEVAPVDAVKREEESNESSTVKEIVLVAHNHAFGGENLKSLFDVNIREEPMEM